MTPSIDAHRNRLRRLRVLQVLYNNRPEIVGDGMILQLIKGDLDLVPDRLAVRQALDYLSQRKFITLTTGPVWVAKITPEGMEYIEGDDPKIDGISHPSEFLS